MHDQLTVIMPTSPIPSNPDTAIIEETIESIRAHKALENVEILIVADGVRPQQMEQRKRKYDEYLQRLLHKANYEWNNVLPIVLKSWGHQANATRAALEKVRTPFILFMEHDTPLLGEFPWEDLMHAARSERVNMIRFYHEAVLQREHFHMMKGFKTPEIEIVGNVPMLQTFQWSQRPHIAQTIFYKDLIKTYFSPESRTMIEDVMHGVVETTFRVDLEAGGSLNEAFDRFKLWIYVPDGDINNMKRSTHLDGREDDPKFDMYFEYEGHETPFAAPARTAGRVD